MQKEQHTVKLIGQYLARPAKTHEAKYVQHFVADGPKGTKEYFKVQKSAVNPKEVVLGTPKGIYPLVWNDAGYYEPKQQLDCEIHIMLKSITGRLIYWT